MSEDARDPNDFLETRIGRRVSLWAARADRFIEDVLIPVRDELDRHLATWLANRRKPPESP